MVPILARIGPLGFELRAWHVAVTLAVITCFVIGPRWAESLEGLDRGAIRRTLVWLGIAALIGMRLHFVINQWGRFVDDPLGIVAFWQGGIHAGGAIILITIAAPFVCRYYGLPIRKAADALIPTVGIGIAIARLGCLPSGCCFGTLTHLPWAISYPEFTYLYPEATRAYVFHASHGLLATGAKHSLPVHPLMLYFSGAGILITFATLWLYPRKRYDGQVALVGLLIFSGSSLGLEFLRADYAPRTYWAGLPQLTWTALAMTLTVALTLAVAEWRYRANHVGKHPQGNEQLSSARDSARS